MFKVKKEVLEAVLNYLGKRSFVEVNNLIAALQQSEPIEEVKEENVEG